MTKIPHGTPGGYNNHGCRCQRCRRAKRDYERTRGGEVRVGARAVTKRRWDEEHLWDTCQCGARKTVKATHCRECVRAAARLRELTILALRAAGLGNAQIAQALHTTTPTVSSMLQRMRRAGVDVPASPYDSDRSTYLRHKEPACLT